MKMIAPKKGCVKVKMMDEGVAGFSEMRTAILSYPNETAYVGYLVIKTKDNAGSMRNKTMRFYHIPEGLPATKKARFGGPKTHLDEHGLNPVHIPLDTDPENLPTLTVEELGKKSFESWWIPSSNAHISWTK